MTHSVRVLLLWTPRILGLAVTLMLGLFALDALDHGKSFWQVLPGFLIHLSPALLLLLVVILSWRWEWIGGIAFVGLAVFYALMVVNRIEWICLISGPLLLVGALFLVSWWKHKELHAV